MTGDTRRGVLRKTGALLVGTALSSRGAVGTASESRSRYIVDVGRSSRRNAERAGVDVVREIEPLELLVVEGAESAVRSISETYYPDLEIEQPPRDRGRPLDTESAAMRPTETQEDPYDWWYATQWNKHAQDLREIHDLTRGDGARVAIIDAGIHTEHPDFSHGAVNVEASRDFTGDGYGVGKAYGGSHGTAVASLVAGNGTWVLGSAPDAELVDCRVFSLALSEGGPVFASNWIDATAYAARAGCDVANLSLGPQITEPVRAQFLDILESTRTLELAAENDLLVVTAAGNSSIDLERYPLYNFSAHRNLMTVSATGPLGFGWPLLRTDGSFPSPEDIETPITFEAPAHEFAPYSSYGKGVIDMSAPGGNEGSFRPGREPPGHFLDNVPVSYVDPGFVDGELITESTVIGWNVGTSFASPEVAAAAALLKSVAPSTTASQLKEELKSAATDVGREDPDPLHGAGFLNPYPAIRDAAPD